MPSSAAASALIRPSCPVPSIPSVIECDFIRAVYFFVTFLSISLLAFFVGLTLILFVCLLLGVAFLTRHKSTAYNLVDSNKRRALILTPTAAIVSGSVATGPSLAVAAGGTPMSNDGLASRLAKKDPTVLRNRIFNKPPSAQVYRVAQCSAFLHCWRWRLSFPAL